MDDCSNKKSSTAKKENVDILGGIVWSLLSRFGTLFITFGANIILARQLSSDDFGVIGLLMIFVALANTILDGGLGTALIQKKNTKEIDYSTVFVFNITISSFLYLVVYCIAPFVAKFYEKDLLADILRVQALILFVNAFRIVQYNILIKRLQFKKLTLIDVSSALIGSIAGISMAYSGFGVWSLVVNNLTYSCVFTLIVNLMATWRPSFRFSISSFKELFSFGGLILISNLIDTLYKNVQNLIVGKAFNISELGYYTQAKKLEEVPVQGVSSAVNSVLFPVYSKFQDNKTLLADKLNNNIDVLTFILFPVMALVVIVAEPMIEILYTAKWNDSVPYFQLLCVAGAILPVNMANLNIIKSQGNGKMYTLMQVFQLVVGVVAMLIGVHWGVRGLICGSIIVSYLYAVIIITLSSKILNTSPKKQFFLIVKNVSISILVAMITYTILYNVDMNVYLSLVVPVVVYVLIYGILSCVFKMSGLRMCVQIISNRRR